MGTLLVCSMARNAALAIRSAFAALADPTRADMVATLAETTSGRSLRSLRTRMQRHPTGRLILAEQPRITEASIDLPRLRTLPASTFGRQYAYYLDQHQFSPDERPPIKYIEDPELAFVMCRYREVHDFWHVLAGIPRLCTERLPSSGLRLCR